MKILRKIIEIDEELCDGCGACVPACHEGALEIIDGKARVVKEMYCDGLGDCIGECPRGALTIIEREADDYDHDAVNERLQKLGRPALEHNPLDRPAGGCPGSGMQTFEAASSPQTAQERSSALSHWPVQIELIPPHAPFLRDASLLVAADCVPVAFPDLHGRLLPGRRVMIGCPKFDDTDEYARKFLDIFSQNDIRDVTVAQMEVPCCSGLIRLVRWAVQQSGKNIPVTLLTISRQGEILPENSEKTESGLRQL